MNPRYLYMMLVYVVTQLLVGALFLAGAWLPFCVGVTALLLVQLNKTLQGTPLQLGNLPQILLYLAAVMYLIFVRWVVGQDGAICAAQLLTLLAALSYMGHPDRSGAMFTILCQLLAFLVIQVEGGAPQAQAVLLLLGLPLLILEWITLAVHDSHAQGRLQGVRNRLRHGVKRRQPPLRVSLDGTYGTVAVAVLAAFILASSVLYVLIPRTASARVNRTRTVDDEAVPELEERYARQKFPDAVDMRSMKDPDRNQFVASVRLRREGSMFRAEGLPLYWKVRTYDRYDGKQWHMEGTSRQIRDAQDGREDGWVELAQARGGLIVEQQIDVVPFEPQVIPVLMSPLAVQARRVWVNPGGGIVGERRAGSQRTRSYVARSVLGERKPDPGDMTSVAERRYVALPREYPKILELVRQVTRGVDSDARRVSAVANYLRNACAYSREFPAPPAGEDQVEHFLFGSRKGHCELFASALVMMLRSIGIPARLVAGFMGGHWQELGAYYKITRGDAHAWAEVRFMRQGWVKVDPTPAAEVATQRSVRQHQQAGTAAARDAPPGADPLRFPDRIDAGPPWHEQLLQMNPDTRARLLDKLPGGPWLWLALGGMLLVLTLFVFPRLRALMARVVPAALGGREGPAGLAAPQVAFYFRALEILGAAGVSRVASETAGELQRRLRRRSREGARVFGKIKRLYHQVRFGGHALSQNQQSFADGWLDQLATFLAPDPEIAAADAPPRREHTTDAQR